MHLSVQPSNGHLLGTQYIGFHREYQLPAFHLQLFPLESLDVCCTCRLHLLLKTKVNICSAVLKHKKVYQSFSAELANCLQTPRKESFNIPLSAWNPWQQICVSLNPGSVSNVVFLSVVCLSKDYNRELMLSPYAHSCTSFFNACMAASISVSNSNNAWWRRHNMGWLWIDLNKRGNYFCFSLLSWHFWSIGGSAVQTCNLSAVS